VISLPPGGNVSNVRAVPQTLKPGRTIAMLLVASSSAVALLTVASDGRGASAAVATNSVTFEDSSGEDAAGPDITTVTIANDDLTNLTFTIAIPNRPTLTGDMFFQLPIDSDANPASGSPEFGGADYLLVLIGPIEGRAEVGLLRWNGTEFTDVGVPQSTLIFSYANGLTLKISASELGGTRRFSFAVFAVTGVVLDPNGDLDFTNIHVDPAPDRGAYTYDVKITPPTLALGNGGARPLKPAVGKLYSQSVSVARSDGAAVQGGRVTCRATVAGAVLRPTGSSFVGTRGTCTFRIPKTAKGKTIRITVTVSAGGLTAARSFSARIA